MIFFPFCQRINLDYEKLDYLPQMTQETLLQTQIFLDLKFNYSIRPNILKLQHASVLPGSICKRQISGLHHPRIYSFHKFPSDVDATGRDHKEPLLQTMLRFWKLSSAIVYLLEAYMLSNLQNAINIFYTVVYVSHSRTVLGCVRSECFFFGLSFMKERLAPRECCVSQQFVFIFL